MTYNDIMKHVYKTYIRNMKLIYYLTITYNKKCKAIKENIEMY